MIEVSIGKYKFRYEPKETTINSQEAWKKKWRQDFGNKEYEISSIISNGCTDLVDLIVNSQENAIILYGSYIHYKYKSMKVYAYYNIYCKGSSCNILYDRVMFSMTGNNIIIETRLPFPMLLYIERELYNAIRLYLANERDMFIFAQRTPHDHRRETEKYRISENATIYVIIDNEDPCHNFIVANHYNIYKCAIFTLEDIPSRRSKQPCELHGNLLELLQICYPHPNSHYI
jgi:hypothetical protein